MIDRNHARRTCLATLIGGCLLVAGVHSTIAQDSMGVRNSTVLGGSALSLISGVSTTNMAAGDGNLQSNSGGIAIGNVASAANSLFQQAVIGEKLANQRDSVKIQDRAFRQSEGWMSINQAAGQGNVQSNTFSVALGISASNLNDTMLQQVMADQQGLSGADGSPGANQNKVEIDSTTFEGSRGVIQVNQSAGTGNATSNSFRLNMALGQ
ncbi:hypothetical protein [Halomonas sp. NO4]|uniref:hypothetical protein n=1 Tax=Halomonas sp. NO4 TaxID=2484813 RepID=UPI0013D68CC1|nr:hypothetical protein [Halomonas sp. NO4]